MFAESTARKQRLLAVSDKCFGQSTFPNHHQSDHPRLLLHPHEAVDKLRITAEADYHHLCESLDAIYVDPSRMRISSPALPEQIILLPPCG
jgi:hypothetical protein